MEGSGNTNQRPPANWLHELDATVAGDAAPVVVAVALGNAAVVFVVAGDAAVDVCCSWRCCSRRLLLAMLR